MSNKRIFYRCSLCGNLVEKIEDSGQKMVCCGKEMDLLVPNTVEAAHEKHIPVCSVKEDELTVTVGSTLHPMTEEHHISWIVIAQGARTQRFDLEKTGEPKAIFKVGPGDITMYAYCNLHGLWEAEFNGYNFSEMVCSPEFRDSCM